LRGLNRLRRLTLNTNNLTDAVLVYVGELHSLEWLEIYGANISDTGLTQMRDLKQLRWLKLEETQVTNMGVEELRRALPMCDIDYRPRRLPSTF